MLEAEAEDNFSRPSPTPRTKFWPRSQLVLEDWTSLVLISALQAVTVAAVDIHTYIQTDIQTQFRCR